MQLPNLKRNYAISTLTLTAAQIKTLYLGANPAGKVKKLLVKNTGANTCFVTMNTQHGDATGVYANIDYAATLDWRLVIRMESGISTLPTPGTTINLMSREGTDIGDFVPHLIKSRGREDEFVVIGNHSAGAIDPAASLKLGPGSGAWVATIVSAEEVPDSTGYTPDYDRYFQVSSVWVQNNGMTLEAGEEKEIVAFVSTTDQSGIESLTFYNSTGGTTVRVESVNH